MPLATGEYVTAARQVGAAEQVLDAVSALSTKELAAKGCRYVTAATRVGRSKQRSRCCWSRAVRCRRRNWRPRAKGGEYVAASRQVAEQRSSCWTRSACVVSAEELAAKYDRCVAASLRAGARVQFVAGSGQYFVARVDVVATRHTIFWLTWPVPPLAGADVPGHIYTSSKQVRWLLTLCKSGWRSCWRNSREKSSCCFLHR